MSGWFPAAARAVAAALALLAGGPAAAAAPEPGCVAHPLAGRDLYLRGSFNSWNADEAQRFVWACDRFELVTRLDGEHRFKVADEAWSADADLGGSPEALAPRGPEMVRRLAPGTYRLTVDAARERLRVEACPSDAPLGDTVLYVRGSMNNWAALEDFALHWHCDAYLLNLQLQGRHEFRVADATATRSFGDGAGNFSADFTGAHTLRFTPDARGRPQVAIGPRRFADPRAARVDDPVALGLRFDSRDLAHKAPFGAQPMGTSFDYRVTAPAGLDALTLVVERRRLEGNQEVLEYTELARVPMQRSAGPSADGRYTWAARHRFESPAIYGTWFEARVGERRFALQNNGDSIFWTREKGSGGRAEVGPYPETPTALRSVRRFRQTIHAPDFRVPDWAADAVYYYVFPERFHNGDPRNDPVPGRDRFHDGTVEKHANWLSRPYRPGSGDGSDRRFNNDFFGGDLQGIIDQLGHIQALGANVLYMTPIFQAASNHKYDTADYHRIDPAFGTNADFERLVREAAQRGIRIVLDTSLNHTGADSVYFDRYGRFGGRGAYSGSVIRRDSPYASWYRFDPTQGDPDRRFTGWVGVTDLPELDKASPAWRDFAYRAPDSVMKRWLDKGAAGWRMDVAPWVPDDFWREWRAAIKAHRPDAITIAETWFDSAKHFLGDGFDSTMNYIFRNTALAYAAGGDARRLVGNLELMREHYPPQALHALMNLLSSHDQARSLHVLGWQDDADAAQAREAKARYRVALLLQMTWPGAPAVYYGDEVGLNGGDDPDNRRPFPWPDLGGRPDEAMHAEFRRLIALRHALPVLRRGELGAPLHVDANVIALPRRLGDTFAITATNNAVEARSVTLTLPPGVPGSFVDRLDGSRHSVRDGTLTLTVPPRWGRVLVSEAR